MKIVREHYLRDDIWCGSDICAECKHECAVLQRDPFIESNLCSYLHYVIPDTNVVLHQVQKASPSFIHVLYTFKLVSPMCCDDPSFIVSTYGYFASYTLIHMYNLLCVSLAI